MATRPIPVIPPIEGAWIRRLLRRNLEGTDAASSYFEVDGQSIGEKNPKWLNNDYVKFIRFAQWRIERTGEGLLGFVTSNSYLDSPTFRGMRQSLMKTFDEIYILDLHGNLNKGERVPDGGRDENVFDIKEGVAIGLFVKRSHAGGKYARVFRGNLWGKREAGPNGGKYNWLATHDVKSTAWMELAPKPPHYLFESIDETNLDEYEKGWKLTDIFPVNSVGIVTARDKFTIQLTSYDLKRVVDDFIARDAENARDVFALGKDSNDWKVASAQRDICDHPDASRFITPVLYRPFDTRFTWYTGRSGDFICRPRPNVMRHMLTGTNLGLVSCRQQSQSDRMWGLCGVTRKIIESCAISNKTREINYLFPLYNTYPESGWEGFDNERKPNLNPHFIKTMCAALGLDFVAAGTNDLSATFGPEDVLYYIYAVFHSLEYRRRYADFLKSDFPRIPLTSNRTLFAKLVNLDQDLASLHLMETKGTDLPTFPSQGGDRVDKVRYVPPSSKMEQGRVWINSEQYFEGVESATWSFTIGGYRPAEKWLKDRKNRILSFDDVTHYCCICAALTETRRIMIRIDEVIENYCGWPLDKAK